MEAETPGMHPVRDEEPRDKGAPVRRRYDKAMRLDPDPRHPELEPSSRRARTASDFHSGR